LDFEEPDSVPLTDDYYIGQFEVIRRRRQHATMGRLGGPNGKAISQATATRLRRQQVDSSRTTSASTTLHGAVWEWREDFFGKYSALPRERNGIQTKNQGQLRPVLRGGAWYLNPGACRSANRYNVGMGGRYGAAGFRVVCVP